MVLKKCICILKTQRTCLRRKVTVTLGDTFKVLLVAKARFLTQQARAERRGRRQVRTARGATRVQPIVPADLNHRRLRNPRAEQVVHKALLTSCRQAPPGLRDQKCLRSWRTSGSQEPFTSIRAQTLRTPGDEPRRNHPSDNVRSVRTRPQQRVLQEGPRGRKQALQHPALDPHHLHKPPTPLHWAHIASVSWPPPHPLPWAHVASVSHLYFWIHTDLDPASQPLTLLWSPAETIPSRPHVDDMPFSSQRPLLKEHLSGRPT